MTRAEPRGAESFALPRLHIRNKRAPPPSTVRRPRKPGAVASLARLVCVVRPPRSGAGWRACPSLNAHAHLPPPPRLPQGTAWTLTQAVTKRSGAGLRCHVAGGANGRWEVVRRTELLRAHLHLPLPPGHDRHRPVYSGWNKVRARGARGGYAVALSRLRHRGYPAGGQVKPSGSWRR